MEDLNTLTKCRLSPIHSHLWYGIIVVEDMFYSYCQSILRDGCRTQSGWLIDI
jgi:hypothetical protein